MTEPESPSVSTTFTFNCTSCGSTVHVVDAKEQSHECSNVPSPDPARVAGYAELIGRLYLQTSGGGVHSIEDIARAVVAVADEERASLVAELKQVRKQWHQEVENFERETLRAEAAEAKVAKVEALADEWDQTIIREQPLADRYAGYYAGVVSARQKVRNDLRAVLADAPAEQRAEVCGHDVGDPPEVCRCLLPRGHSGLHSCKHTERAEGGA